MDSVLQLGWCEGSSTNASRLAELIEELQSNRAWAAELQGFTHDDGDEWLLFLGDKDVKSFKTADNLAQVIAKLCLRHKIVNQLFMPNAFDITSSMSTE